MNFEEQIKFIQAAAGDPKRLALAVLEITLAQRPAQLRRVVDAAAIPRWFDSVILEALLDNDLRADAQHWFSLLASLGCIERFEGRAAWNVHETTRLAIRELLQINDPERIAVLSARAMGIFVGSTSRDCIERTYHHILADPNGCYDALRAVESEVQACPADALALAQALAEYSIHGGWPGLTRAWALLVRALNLSAYRRLEESLADCLAAESVFRGANHPAGLAWCENSLGVLLQERAQPGDSERALGHYERSLELRERLLDATPESAQTARDVSVSLSDLADFLARRGQSGDAEQALDHYQRSLEILERLLEANPESAQTAREVSVSLSKLADFLAMRGQSGDAEQALGHYQRSLEIDQRLLEANPESAQAAQDMSVSLSKLADFLARRGQSGDAEQALGHYQRSLGLSERLLEANPESAQTAREVSVGLGKLADFLAMRGQSGDAEQALGHYQRSLEIDQRLLEANPESAHTAREVSVGLSKLADFLARRGQSGDAEQALGHYQRGLENLERLLEANPESAEAARAVSVSLSKLADFLATRGQSGDAEQALGHYQRSLGLSERLLEANPESAHTAREVSVGLGKLADFLARRGQSGDAEQALGHYQHSLEILERLLEANPESAQTAREVSVGLGKLADFLARRGQSGDAEQALDHYQRGLENLERLLEANPESAQTAREVSVGLSKLADFLAMRGQSGDAEQALGHYQRSLEIDQRLLEANPESAEAAREVSVSLSKLADFLARRGQSGDAEQALGHYQHSLEILERLLDANPESAQTAREVSVSLSKLADFLARRGQSGDAEQALGEYQRSLEILERLLDANPESAEAAREVSVGLSKLADFLARRGQSGDAEQALDHYQRSLEILERLLEANPNSAHAARDVSVALGKLADFLARRGQSGDAERALGHYQRSLELSERLLKAAPESAEAARAVSVSLSKLADFLARRGQSGDAEQALGHYQRSLGLSERLLEANPESAEAAREVSVSLSKLADFLARRGQSGDAERALGHYQRSLEILERLLDANPESAEAARDVLISLERMAQARSQHPDQTSAREALALQVRALEIALKLRDSNPHLAFYGTTAAIAFVLASQRALAAGDQALAVRYLAGCHALLQELVTLGMHLDDSMDQMYQALTARFGEPRATS